MQTKTYEGTIIAVDFDGTCVAHEFPQIGKEIGAPRILKRLVDAGAKLILYTMRSDNRTPDMAKDGKTQLDPDLLTAAVNWFKQHQIPLYGIQANPTQHQWTTSPKAYANIYIDDAALGCPLKTDDPQYRPYVDWAAVENILFPTV